jgi:hypothetical protein
VLEEEASPKDSERPLSFEKKLVYSNMSQKTKTLNHSFPFISEIYKVEPFQVGVSSVTKTQAFM